MTSQRNIQRSIAVRGFDGVKHAASLKKLSCGQQGGSLPAGWDLCAVERSVRPLIASPVNMHYNGVNLFSRYVLDVIGGLGYHDGPHRQPTLTQRLDLADFSIQRMETTGDEPPAVCIWASLRRVVWSAKARSFLTYPWSLGPALRGMDGIFRIITTQCGYHDPGYPATQSRRRRRYRQPLCSKTNRSSYVAKRHFHVLPHKSDRLRQQPPSCAFLSFRDLGKFHKRHLGQRPRSRDA